MPQSCATIVVYSKYSQHKEHTAKSHFENMIQVEVREVKPCVSVKCKCNSSLQHNKEREDLKTDKTWQNWSNHNHSWRLKKYNLIIPTACLCWTAVLKITPRTTARQNLECMATEFFTQVSPWCPEYLSLTKFYKCLRWKSFYRPFLFVPSASFSSWWSVGGSRSGWRWCWCQRNCPRPPSLKWRSPELHGVSAATSVCDKAENPKTLTQFFYFHTLQLSEYKHVSS